MKKKNEQMQLREGNLSVSIHPTSDLTTGSQFFLTDRHWHVLKGEALYGENNIFIIPRSTFPL